MAQTITQLSQNTEDLCKRSARVVRIAVAPECHQQGVGSSLLNYCEKQLDNCDYFGASFGANASLVKFWQSNGFKVIKLGFSHDKATAEHSALVIKPLTRQARHSVTQLNNEFKHDFSLQLLGHFSHLPWQLIAELLPHFSQSECPTALLTRAERLLNTEFTLFSAQPLLWQLFWHTPISLHLLNKDTKRILIRLILQQTGIEHFINEASLSGKKALNTQFKTAVQGWYAHFKLLHNIDN